MITYKQERAAAESLVNWLNQTDPELTKGQQEVQVLMQLLCAKNLKPNEREKILRSFGRIRWEYSLTHGGMVEVLKNSRLASIGKVVYDPDPSRGTLLRPDPIGRTEADNGLILLSQVSPHILNRIGQCARCRKYLFSKRRRKVFCSEVCQQGFWIDYRKTPAGRKKQREQIRRWRTKQRENSKGGDNDKR